MVFGLMGMVIPYTSDYDIYGKLLTGTLVNRPDAGILDRWYYATDTNQTFYDNGIDWILVQGIGDMIEHGNEWHEPDFAYLTHWHNETYALIVHWHNETYAFVDHNHDDRYSLLGHDHDDVYALLTHWHNETYAAIIHWHNETYSLIDHNHDGVYAPLSHTHTESDIIDLEHDAVKILGVPVDDTDRANGKVLMYNATSGKLEYESVGIGDYSIYGKIQVDNFADRPITGVQDQWFYANDTEQLFYWNVSAWYEISLGNGDGMVEHGNEWHDPDFLSEIELTYQFVAGTSNTQTNSVTWVDLLQMTLTVASSGTYLIMFVINVAFIKAADDRYCQARILKDSTILAGSIVVRDIPSTTVYGNCVLFTVGALTANQIVKVQWVVSNTDSTVYSLVEGIYAQLFRRSLLIIKMT